MARQSSNKNHEQLEISEVPIRETTNPNHFIREHLYPTFIMEIYLPNMANKKKPSRIKGKWRHYY